MIEQSAVGLNSRSEAIVTTNFDALPLITAPMSTVVDYTNYHKFYEQAVRVCLPRTKLQNIGSIPADVFHSVDLATFEDMYIKNSNNSLPHHICIDVANGNMPQLHSAIEEARRIHIPKIIIMSGNVSSLDAFIRLQSAGCDYIRVGIGGGSACTTTVHTGVGQEDLEYLIAQCYLNSYNHVRIVADGISSFIRDKNLHRNGYAAINRLLAAGASYVMLGAIFNKAKESAGEKIDIAGGGVHALYRGMSTKEEQKIYRVDNQLRHSEGLTTYNKVEYSLAEWLGGSETSPDEFPGFQNALASAMAYTGCPTLSTFIGYSARKLVAKRNG